MIDRELLEILACPLDKAEVRHVQDATGEWILCTKCARRYPVRDDIPVMLVEEAVLSVPGGTGPGGTATGGTATGSPGTGGPKP
jgi:hypothetical protein